MVGFDFSIAFSVIFVGLNIERNTGDKACGWLVIFACLLLFLKVGPIQNIFFFITEIYSESAFIVYGTRPRMATLIGMWSMIISTLSGMIPSTVGGMIPSTLGGMTPSTLGGMIPSTLGGIPDSLYFKPSS